MTYLDVSYVRTQLAVDVGERGNGFGFIPIFCIRRNNADGCSKILAYLAGLEAASEHGMIYLLSTYL